MLKLEVGDFRITIEHIGGSNGNGYVRHVDNKGQEKRIITPWGIEEYAVKPGIIRRHEPLTKEAAVGTLKVAQERRRKKYKGAAAKFLRQTLSPGARLGRPRARPGKGAQGAAASTRTKAPGPRPRAGAKGMARRGKRAPS